MSRNTNQIEKPKGPIMNADRLAVEWLRCQRRRVCVLAVALTACGAIGLVPQIVKSDVVVVDVVAVAQGLRTGDLKGKPVLNEKNERIGTIDDLIIGKDRVLFGILQVGGFLGIGSHFVAVPYQSLRNRRGAHQDRAAGCLKRGAQESAGIQVSRLNRLRSARVSFVPIHVSRGVSS